MYVGDMVQSVQTKVSYKSKKKKSLPKSNWDIVKNTHEPLVDRYIFESVQNNIKRTTKTTITKREKRLFENLLYCKECGNTLTISYRKNYDYSWYEEKITFTEYNRRRSQSTCKNSIPKKELNRETLEEAAHKMLVDYGIKSMGQSIGVLTVKKLMVDMAKWQQEQDKNKFSEEDVKEAFYMGEKHVATEKKVYPQSPDFETWFKQFKNK